MSKGKKWLIAIAVILTLLLIGVLMFIRKANEYDTVLLPNTYINSVDVGERNEKEALELLVQEYIGSDIDIKSGDKLVMRVYAMDIFDTTEMEKVVKEAKSTQSKNSWLLYSILNKQRNYSIDVDQPYSEELLIKLVSSMIIEQVESKNATLSYNESAKQYEIVKEVYGNQYQEGDLVELIKTAISSKKTEINLLDISKQPEVKSDDNELIARMNNLNRAINVKVTYDFGDRSELVPKELIKSWITETDGVVDFNADLVREYEVTLAKKYDTFGASRKFITSEGDAITISGGSYGWMMHRMNSALALIETIKAGEDATIEPVYSYTALIRDENDIGKSYVEISLSKQKVWVYINGEMVVETDCVTGNISNGNGTPTGIYQIAYKQRNTTLDGANYSAKVAYWMPFNKGIGLHDASWRGKFGGQIYKTDGSHGCVNLPSDKAGEIYKNVYEGMPVIVY